MEPKTLTDVLAEALPSCEAMLRYPKPVNADSIRFWAQALRAQSPKVVSRAFDRWIHTKPDFPTPCEILELCSVVAKESSGALEYEVPDFATLPSKRHRRRGLTRELAQKGPGEFKTLANFTPTVPMLGAKPAATTQTENLT